MARVIGALSVTADALGGGRGMVRDHRQPAVEVAQVQHSAHRPVAGQHHEA